MKISIRNRESKNSVVLDEIVEVKRENDLIEFYRDDQSYYFLSSDDSDVHNIMEVIALTPFNQTINIITNSRYIHFHKEGEIGRTMNL